MFRRANLNNNIIGYKNYSNTILQLHVKRERTCYRKRFSLSDHFQYCETF